MSSAESHEAQDVPKAARGGRRIFVTAWVLLGLSGAANQTLLPAALGRRFDLVLPHLKYGYVMFARNPRKLVVFEYSVNGAPRNNIANLGSSFAAPGYQRARISMSILREPRYLEELCSNELRAHPRDDLRFFVKGYDLDRKVGTPTESVTLDCTREGLRRREAD